MDHQSRKKIPGKWLDLFLKMRQFEKKIRQNLKFIENGRLSKGQLKAKIIYRKGGGKRPKSLCIVYI